MLCECQLLFLIERLISRPVSTDTLYMVFQLEVSLTTPLIFDSLLWLITNIHLKCALLAICQGNLLEGTCWEDFRFMTLMLLFLSCLSVATVKLCHLIFKSSSITSSFVRNFVAICELKLELRSGNAQIGAKFVLASVCFDHDLDLLQRRRFCQW